MALERKRKSVLFHQGISDGADRFLLEPPAIDYAENLMFHKDGSLQKRPGFGPDELTTVPNATGIPVAMLATDNSLHVVSENGARSWNGASWEETDASGFIGTSSVEVESQNFIGLGGCCYQTFADSNGDKRGHAIAYEVRGENSLKESSADSEKHVIVQRYDVDGRFVDQRRFDDARSPQVVQRTHGIAVLTLFYQDIPSKSLKMLNIQAPHYASTIAGSPIDLNLEPSSRPRMPNYSIVTGEEDPNPGKGPRLGQGVYGQARYFVGYSESNSRFYILYTHDAGVGVYMRAVDDTSGSIVDSATIYGVANAQADILAFEVNELLNIIVVVYQRWNRGAQPTLGTGSYAVVAQLYPTDDLSSTLGEYNIVSGTSANNMPLYTHGTVGTYLDVGSGLPVAYSMVALHMSGYPSGSAYSWGESPTPPPTNPGVQGNTTDGRAIDWLPWNNRSWEAGIKTFGVAWGAGVVAYGADLSAHRITTNPVRHNDKWYMGVQQWIDYTPHHYDPSASPAFANCLPATKPVTTAICVFDYQETMRPVATLDAGASGHVDYAESEVAIHLGTLKVEDGDLIASNRVKLSAEDNSLWIGVQLADQWTRVPNVEVSSDSLCRVHRIKSGGEGAYAANFGDGIALSTAVPMWYDARFFSEFGPIDSPEIMVVADHDYSTWDVEPRPNHAYMGNMPTQGYDEVANADDLVYRKFAVIYGFVDTHGNTHRSAPSQTLYVADLEEGLGSDGEEWPGRRINVYVTRPLSVLREDLEYFVEVYVSSDADSDMQLAMQSSARPTTTHVPIVVTFQLNRTSAATTHKLTRASESLYTSGGVLAADPWPAFAYSVVTSTRFWAIDSNNKGRVLPSKLFEDFVAPEYNPLLTINLGDERNLTAIGKLDDKVVVFEPNDIHVIYGDGPDNRGQGQDFAVHYISTDVGCEDQESVIETPAGLIFYSKPRGFYLLDRNLQVQFIGDGIEDVARDVDIVSATLVPKWAEVRFLVDRGPLTPREEVIIPDQIGPIPGTAVFTTPGLDRPTWPTFNNGLPEDSCLVFNYEKSQWSIYSNYTGRASTIYQNQYTQLLPDWSVWQEAVDEGRDPTGTNRSLLRTPCIRLSDQIQGFSRLWKVTFLGRYLSSLQDSIHISDPLNTLEGGDVMVRAWFDYESATGLPAQEKLYRFQDFGFNQFNDSRLRAERFQFEWTPERGRCQAVKFEIEEVNSESIFEGQTYHLGRGFEIVSADFDVGVSPMRSLLPQGVKK